MRVLNSPQCLSFRRIRRAQTATSVDLGSTSLSVWNGGTRILADLVFVIRISTLEPVIKELGNANVKPDLKEKTATGTVSFLISLTIYFRLCNRLSSIV